jgi:predicted nucleic acid-binding protein
MIVVDTSVLSGALGRKARPRGKEADAVEAFKKLVRSKSRLGVPGIVVQEVLSKISDRDVFERLRVRLQGLELLLADADDHVLAAEIANDCLRAGVAATTIDCLIAATTIRAGARLLTTDGDFAAIARHSSLEIYEP